ncbi:hypothetical protein ABL78_6515 [Leptomonas seymouri]|uniref:Uncharacterized protein n=1 Tax=Leptomonas seymouri TaxID=5684 RepID=A0A0N1PCU2_LEPSE|nr:hypothetical protein ABL78_6515 [Leptomonas seymouri]|eukprot:KPI84433.1 hypothetical protein ABL78_6515 [Leptomonas seymouri]
MSAFTTPSRVSTAHAAATQRAGNSSGRRVVRSALETLMDTATPELRERGASGGSASAPRHALSSTKRPPAVAAVNAAPTTSPFSVTYTTAPPGRSTQGDRLPTRTSPHVSAPSSSASVKLSSTRAHRRTGASPSAAVVTHAPREEPSALAFLSPQGKAARASSSSSLSQPDERSRQSRRSSSQHHRTRVAEQRGNDNMEDASVLGSTSNGKRGRESGGWGASASVLFTPSASAPASPSRSLYADVEAAQQQPLDRLESGDDTPPSPSVAAVGTSFVVANGGGDDDDASYTEEDSEGSRPSASAQLRRLKDDDGAYYGDEELEPANNAAVPAAEVEALISAALRRYEKERDAEEEEVLQQVSAEVEAQAARHATLLEDYNSVRRDYAQLQEKLAATSEARNALEQALQSARQTQQSQRESMKRLEVELYHARDAQTHEQQQQRAQMQSESAEWEATRRRYERRQATLEAQLSQLREELQTKTDVIADMTRQMDSRDKEMSALRQRVSQRETSAEDEYVEIHQRMLLLGQNMSTMETTLRERDSIIARLRDELAATTAANRDCSHDVRELQEAMNNKEAQLASARESMQKQADDLRRRMHRLTSLEHQKNALKSEVGDARRALSTSAEAQARALKELEDFVEEVKRYTADAQSRNRQNSSSASGFESPRSSLLQGNADDVFFAGGQSAAHTPHPDDTLVYEEWDDGNTSGAPGSGYSSGSDAEATSSLTSATMEGGGNRKGDDVGHHQNSGRLFSTPNSSRRPSPSSRRMPGQTHTATATATTTTTTKTSKSMTDFTPGERDTHSLKRLSKLLHHNVAQAQIVVRELRRRVAALARQQRKMSPATARSRSSTPAGVASADAGAARRPPSSVSPLDTSSNYTTGQRHDIVRKLEQACRYLKSELTTAKSQLSEAQAECQWRTLSMKKWEDDVQAARREVLSLEKERLQYTTEREMFEPVRRELEERLAESSNACEAARTALEEVTAAQQATQRQLEEVTAAKESARAALEKEQNKSARLAAKTEELAAAQETLTGELEVLRGKHKTALESLQALRAQEATQQLKDRQDSRVRHSELSELREAMGAWEAERAALQSTVAALQDAAEGLKEKTVESSRRCAALESEGALHVELETTTLITIASILAAPPFAWREANDGTSSALATDAHDSNSAAGVSPTEKKLFGVDEPSVEEIVMEEDGEAVATVVRARLQQHQLTHTPSRHASSFKRRTPSSTSRRPTTTSSQTTPTLRKAKPSAAGFPRRRASIAAPEIAATASSAQLARLRQHLVATAQRVALELVRLRALAGHDSSPSPSPLPSQHRQQPRTHASRGLATADAHDDSPGAWFGATAAYASPSANHRRQGGDVNEYLDAPLAPYEGEEASPMDHSSPVVPFTAPRSSLVHSPPLPHDQPSVNLRRSSRAGQRVATTSSAAAAKTPAASSYQRQNSSSARQRQQQEQPYGPSISSPRPQHEHALSTAHSPETEHIYNVSPWTLSQGLRSPSASPPVVGTAAAAAKVWSEVRRSPSTEDGLSAYSHSATRGGVDGSGSPARPPSLRATSAAPQHR